MDKGIVLVTIIFLAVIILPFLIVGYSKKKKKNRFINIIRAMAEKSGCTITRHEISNNFIIGMDDSSGCLFFYKKETDREISREINLKNFKSCKLANISRTVEDNKNNYHMAHKLELCFYPVEANQPDEIIEFYNDEYDSLTLTGELQVIEKWEDELNRYLKNFHKVRPAAPAGGTPSTGKKKKKSKKA